jgi:DNA-binding response OmpR family regulator
MILTNGEMKEDEYEEIINAGTDDFFLKPLPIKKILLHLRKGLKQRQNLLQKRRLADELNRNSPRKRYPG